MKAKLFALSALSAVALLGSAAPSLADGAEAKKSNWSGSVSLTSDYRFRGISQTDRNPAVQGGIQYTGSQGIYVGAWASNVEFASDVSTEIDVYAGYTYAIDDKTAVSGQFIYYWYPNANNGEETNYWEVSAKLEHQLDMAGLYLEVAYAPAQASDAYSKSLSIKGGVEAGVVDSLPLFSDGLSVSANLGHQGFDDNTLVGLEDYMFYDIGATATAGAFSLDVRYINTNLSEAECYGGLDWCEGGVVVTGAVSFGG